MSRFLMDVVMPCLFGLLALLFAWRLYDLWRDWRAVRGAVDPARRLLSNVEALVRQVNALSHAVGELLGHPYDVACPKCGVPKHYPCSGGSYRRHEGHEERHAASPLSAAERATGRTLYLVKDDGEDTVT